KANKLGVLEWMFNHMSFKPSSLEKIIKWEYRYNMIKVNDGKFHSKHLKIPGCVAIDVRSCFMGIYSKAEKSSLAFYLNECGLESKMDMPIHRMNKYYERALKEPDSMSAEQMREVAKYCIIDALSCQRLMVKHNAINEYREVASVAFLSLFDAHYFAGGKRNEMKKRLAPLKEKKEDMDLVISSMGKSLSLSEAIEQILANAEVEKRNGLTKNLYHFIHKEKHEFIAEYDSICFDCSCLDKKQYAFKEDNGSPYLKMAYEEVLFPVVFTGKKKYYGIPHESKPNFNKKLFIRGVEVVKRGQSKHFREVGKKVMGESMRLDNTRTLRRIVEDVLKETINDISQIDLNGVIKTAVWKPDKNNKSVQRFISRMRDRHTREEADAKRLIKRGLTSEPYLYEIPEPGERFEYVVVENDSSDKVGDKMEYPEVVRRLGKKIDISYYLKTVVGLCARFINYDESFQPSSEIVLEALKKLKDANKAGDNKADDGGVDGDDLDEDEEDEDEMDEDEVSKIRDALAQKSAEKWIRGYIKSLRDGPKKDKTIISHLWEGACIYAKKLFDTTYADKGEHLTNNAYYQSLLNALDKQEESIRLKLSSLLKEISEVDIEYRDSMYKLVTKKRHRAMSLEQYLTSYYLDEWVPKGP
ncbi:DNA/RNA polymerase, partial [Rhizophagus irregularis]